jgi:glycosyltransferase involved in cell wall biosynthesis
VRNVAKPTITVLIDTYNHERFIEEALVSVIEQDFSPADVEILVVDDGSTDRTPEIVRKFEPRVRLIRKKNGGQASAFNAGIPEAHGEIVAFLDGDDWWARNKLSLVVDAMSADAELGIVGHGIITVHRDGREQSEMLREEFRFQADTVAGARLFRLRKSFLGTSRMTIRASLLRRIGPVPEALTVEADEYLFTLASVLALAQILPDALTFYRLHDANAFLLSGKDPAKVRTKQDALAALSKILSGRLENLGVEPRARRVITEIVQAEADQVRLSIDGGWPWETVAVEWTIYATLYPKASPVQRGFRALSLLPALAIPPRMFYSIRQRLARSGFYLRGRRRLLPVPEPAHAQRSWKTGN